MARPTLLECLHKKPLRQPSSQLAGGLQFPVIRRSRPVNKSRARIIDLTQISEHVMPLLNDIGREPSAVNGESESEFAADLGKEKRLKRYREIDQGIARQFLRRAQHEPVQRHSGRGARLLEDLYRDSFRER